MRRGPAMREQNLQPQWERDEEAEIAEDGTSLYLLLAQASLPTLWSHLLRLMLVQACTAQNGRHCRRSQSSWHGSFEVVAPTRICNSCHAELQLPPQLQNIRGPEAVMAASRGQSSGDATSRSGVETQFDQGGLRSTLAPPSDVSSRASELTECPVCSTSLSALGAVKSRKLMCATVSKTAEEEACKVVDT